MELVLDKNKYKIGVYIMEQIAWLEVVIFTDLFYKWTILFIVSVYSLPRYRL